MFCAFQISSHASFLFDLSDRILGKYYFEAVVTDEGLCRVGWATLKAKLELGTDKEGFGFGGTGKKSFGRQFDSYGEVIEKISQFKGKFSFSLESRKAGPLDERQTTNLFTYKKQTFLHKQNSTKHNILNTTVIEFDVSLCERLEIIVWGGGAVIHSFCVLIRMGVIIKEWELF